MLEKVHRYQTKRDYVVEVLREAISSGQIQPGQRLRQEELAADLGISQTPVREALRKLEAEGLVSHVPHKGVRVAEISLDEAEELYRIRAALEGLAAKLVVENLNQGESTDALKKLEKLVQEMHSLQQKNKLKELANLNTEFHMTLYTAARSPRLYRMIAGLWSSFPRDALWVIPGEAERLIGEHEAILAGLQERDAGKAVQAISDHCANSGHALVNYIKESTGRNRL